MQVKTFTGTSTKDIMARIKDELGPDAIILGTQKRSARGVTTYEIMAALDTQPAPTGTSEPSAPLGQEDASCLREEWTRLRKQLMAVLKPQIGHGAPHAAPAAGLRVSEREGVKEDVLMDLWDKFRRSPDTPPSRSWKAWSGSPRGWRRTGNTRSTSWPALTAAARPARPCAWPWPGRKARTGPYPGGQRRPLPRQGTALLRHYTELSGLSYRELDTREHWSACAATRRATTSSGGPARLPGRQTLESWLGGVCGGSLPPCHIIWSSARCSDRPRWRTSCPGFAARLRPALSGRSWTKPVIMGK